jgi:hypothetical protein
MMADCRQLAMLQTPHSCFAVGVDLLFAEALWWPCDLVNWNNRRLDALQKRMRYEWECCGNRLLGDRCRGSAGGAAPLAPDLSLPLPPPPHIRSTSLPSELPLLAARLTSGRRPGSLSESRVARPNDPNLAEPVSESEPRPVLLRVALSRT